MARQSGTGSGGIRLDGVALIEQPLVVELLEQPPQGLNVFIVISDIGMIQIDEISHLLGQLAPLCRKLHHVLAAFVVIVLHRDILV